MDTHLNKNKDIINDLLYGDRGKFGYLFPYRDSIPDITSHLLQDIKYTNKSLSEYVVEKMLDIEYLGWTVKVLLGIELFPIQIAILQNLWNTSFPMLIASRGGGKCIVGESLCRTSDGLLRIDEIIDKNSSIMEKIPIGYSILGENGYRQPEYGWNNGVSKTKKIQLDSGITLEGTLNHPIRYLDNNGEIRWKQIDQLNIGDIVPIVRKQYYFGSNTETSKDLAWFLGAMMSDGMFTQGSHILFSNDNDLVNNKFINISIKEFSYKPKPIKQPDHLNTYSVKIFDKLNNKYGIGYKNAYTKEIPLLIRKSTREIIQSFLQGMFDADGFINEDGSKIQYYSCSKILIEQLQQILLGFCIISTIRYKRTKCNNKYFNSYILTIYNQENIKLYQKYIGFTHSMKLNRLKNRKNKTLNVNKDLIYNINHIMLRLRNKYKQLVGLNKKGEGKNISNIISPHNIKSHNISYKKLYKFLQQTKILKEDKDWQHLNNLLNKHYYFDKIVEISNSENQTFDVYIPDDHSFISNGMISHNSYLLAIYALLKAILEPGTKIAIVGAGLRQAKLVFAYIETIWSNSKILRNIVGGGRKSGPKQQVDLCYMKIGDSIIYAIPTGDGSRIRGFRANIVLADEFSTIPEEIFDVVVRGFASTTKSPVEQARLSFLQKELEKFDIPKSAASLLIGGKQTGNQIIYSGTAYYAFNHFYKRFEMWNRIIKSQGNIDDLIDIFGTEYNIPDGFDYRDYSIIRLPYNQLPEGLLDHKQLANAKATLPTNIFNMEYGACFVADSDGVFQRSLLEACTANPSRPISTPDGEVQFDPLMRGEKNRKYVIGIDPAAEQDQLALVVLEIWPNHYRIVHCWAINKKEFNRRKKNGLITEDDYYAYCCSKIREFYQLFKPIRIEMDSQGGGYAISEMLRNKKLVNFDEGQFPIYEIIDPDNKKPTDIESDGPHVINLVSQTNEFNARSNLILHKSFETKRILFPAFDTVKLHSSLIAEHHINKTFDTYEDCLNDIEELKNQLCLIQCVETPSGKQKFDVISTTRQSKSKGRLKKDRYTALLLAHAYIYDQETNVKVSIDYEDVPGNFKKVKDVDPNEPMYRGPGMARLKNGQEWQKNSNMFGGCKKGKQF